MSLTFKKLSKKLQQRTQVLVQKKIFKHNPKDYGFYGLALAGEVGEVCNLLKKVLRGTKQLNQKTIKELSHELADVQCYLSLLAQALDIDLEDSVIDKFNLRSKELGVEVTL